MIQIFCSKKLHEFVGEVQIAPTTENIERNLKIWNGHLFFLDRKKCLVFVNNLTNYSVFMTDFAKKDLANFETLFYHRLEEQLRYDHVIANSQAFDSLFPRDGFQFFKTNNDRRITGRINDLVQTFKAHRFYKYECFDDMRIVHENGLMNTLGNRGSGEDRNKWSSASNNFRKAMG